MRNLIRALVLLPAFAFTGCGGGDGADPQPQTANLGTEFVLGYGETVDVGSLSITFAAVTEDSRCPINANCVAGWEGNARIQLAVTNGRTSAIIEPNTNQQFIKYGIFDDHMINLVRLDPLPYAPPRSPETYEATLLVYDHVIYSGN